MGITGNWKLRAAMAMAAAVAGALGADRPAPEKRLADLNIVALDNDKQPVRDLTRDDIEVFDDGKPQTIAFFRRYDSRLKQVPKLAPNEFSNRGAGNIPDATVILFDMMNQSFASRGVAANRLAKDLSSLESGRFLYLYFLTIDGRLLAVRALPESGGQTDGPGGEQWVRESKPLLDQTLKNVMRVRPVDMDVAVRVQLTFRALNALRIDLSQVPGRKNLVWITDGVPISLGPRRSDTGEFVDFTDQWHMMSDELVRSGIAVYPARQVMIGSADNVDGSTPGQGAGSEATLDEIAHTTGGRSDGGKDIGGVVKQAMNDVRSSYLVGYYPPDRNWNGKFHKLRVVCRRKGVRIQAKSGYYAWAQPPQDEEQQAMEPAAAAAFDAAEIGLRASLAPDPKDPQVTHLGTVIDARDIALAQDGSQYRGALRVEVVGYDANGSGDRSALVPLDLAYSGEDRDKALAQGIGFDRDIKLDGRLRRLRVIVYDINSGAVGSVTVPLNPPAVRLPN